jgi:hypothetical protein
MLTFFRPRTTSENHNAAVGVKPYSEHWQSLQPIPYAIIPRGHASRSFLRDHFERFCRVPVAVGELLVEMSSHSKEGVRGGLFC